MKSSKKPKDIVEDSIQSPESSDSDDSVLEKTKATLKEKKPYIMTEARKANMEKMRLARNANVEKRRELKQVDDDKKNAEKSLADTMLEKKTKKTQKETKVIKTIQVELSESESESESEVEIKEKIVKKPRKKAVERTKKIVCDSDSESDEEPVQRSNTPNYVFV
jgi:hypothetical protein